MTAKVVAANGVSLYAESFGDASNPPILLIMGAMASGVWWPEEFCGQLAARDRFVVRYDHRDTGASTSFEPGTATYGVEDLAADAIAVLDAYGLDRAHLVGMSLGGYLSQLIALKDPGCVLTLTLISSEPLAASDPAIRGIDPAVIAYHERTRHLDWSDRAAVLEYQVGAWRLLNGSAHPFDEAHVRKLVAADLHRTPDPRTPFNHAMLTDAGEGWLGRLDEIRVPALIIHGTEDQVLPYAHALALEAALPDARLITLQGSGHELHPADWPVMIDAIVAHTA